MRVHLVDGTFELFRAHFSRRPRHLAPAGWEAKATVGLATSLLALVHDERTVTHVAVAFDNPIRSFRNDLWPGYKSDEGVPAELRAQFDAAEEATRALGITAWSMREFEADDALRAFLAAVPRCRAAVLASNGAEAVSLGDRLWALPIDLLLS
jgi:5'-3' exonuclease